MTLLIRRFLTDESGATAIEYGLIIALIFLVILASVQLFATNATALFDQVATAVGSAMGPSEEG
ncbi:MAG: Flp family type IVb pilin [Alphaproteobacteria bacterium]|nr:Flp family type IVb pilin [Alphaproteobacteria bacterium]MBU2378857.1 Flp family type IVb pilin [Alphaproteobacteria bacterium]